MTSKSQCMLSIALCLAYVTAFADASPKPDEDLSSSPGEPSTGDLQEVPYTTTPSTTTTFKYNLEPLNIPGGCSNDTTDVIDERQKGSENYKVSLNGIRIIVAPPNALMGSLLADMKKQSGEHDAVAHDNTEKDKPSSGVQHEKQKRRLHISLPWLLKSLNFGRPHEQQ